MARDRLAGFREKNAESDVDDLSDYERNYVFDAHFQVIDELRSRTGLGYVLHQAREEARQAVIDLIDCDLADGDKARELQWRARRFNELYKYAFQIIEAGKVVREDMTEDVIAALEKEAGKQRD